MPKPSQVEPEKKRRRLPPKGSKKSPDLPLFDPLPAALIAGQPRPEITDFDVGKAASGFPEALIAGQPRPESAEGDVEKAAPGFPEALIAGQLHPEPAKGDVGKAAPGFPEAAVLDSHQPLPAAAPAAGPPPPGASEPAPGAPAPAARPGKRRPKWALPLGRARLERAAQAEAPADLLGGLAIGTIRPLGPRRARLERRQEAAPLDQQLPPKTPSAPSGQPVATEAGPVAQGHVQPAPQCGAQVPAPAVGLVPAELVLERERSAEAYGPDVEADLERAAAWLERADALLVGSGAGMGVDAGLATFRGASAARALPGLERRGLTYEEICDPKWFKEEPQLAWSFWESCHRSYQAAKPHAGYGLIQQWASNMPFGAFSYTSNVDSHWLRSGWGEQRLVEVHGAIRLMQCSTPCSSDAWATPETLGLVQDMRRTRRKLPLCPRCEAVARPSVMMFGQDSAFSQARRATQEALYEKWLRALEERASKEYLNIVCLEVGCGVTVSTVRRELETLMGRFPSARLIRVNPEQSKVGDLQDRGVGLPLGALEALQELERRLQARAVRRVRLWRSKRRRGFETREHSPDSTLEKTPPPLETVEDIFTDSALTFEPRRSIRIADRVMRAKRATPTKGEEADEHSAEEAQEDAQSVGAPAAQRRRRSGS